MHDVIQLVILGALCTEVEINIGQRQRDVLEDWIDGTLNESCDLDKRVVVIFHLRWLNCLKLVFELVLNKGGDES